MGIISIFVQTIRSLRCRKRVPHVYWCLLTQEVSRHSCFRTPIAASRCGWVAAPSQADIRDALSQCKTQRANFSRRLQVADSYLISARSGWLTSFLGKCCRLLHQVWLTAGWPVLASTRPHKVSSIIHSGLRWIGHKVSAAAGIRSVCLNFLFLFRVRPSVSWFHAWNYPSLSALSDIRVRCHRRNLLTFWTTEAVNQVTSDS